MKNLITIMLILFSATAIAEEKPTTLIYDGDVLEIPIKTGVETRIILDFDASIGYDPSTATKGVSTKILPSGIFVKASNPFENDYAEIAENGGKGQIIPIRLISNDRVNNAPTKYKIVNTTIEQEKREEIIDIRKENRAIVKNVLPSTGTSKDNLSQNSIVNMIRFTASSLFGAPRHQVNLNGIEKVETIKEKYRLFSGGRIKTTVISSHRYQGLFITAIKIKNLSHHEYEIDPRKIIGHWLYAGLHDSSIIEGKENGVIYLISTTPFDEAISKVVNWRKL